MRRESTSAWLVLDRQENDLYSLGMEILCPIHSLREVDVFLDAGATLFYAGVSPTALLGRDDETIPNARRWKGSNFATEELFEQALQRIHERSAKLHLAVNWTYNETDCNRIIGFAKNHAVDALIIADLHLLQLARQQLKDMPIVLSTLCPVMNRRAVRFFSEMGVNKMVLPRHLGMPRIARLVQENPDIEFEVFIKNQDCMYENGYCFNAHEHLGEPHYHCGGLRQLSEGNDLSVPCSHLEEFDGGVEFDGTGFNGRMFNNCGLCALRQLDAAGVHTAKIVGRGMDPSIKLKDFLLVKCALSLREIADEDFGDAVRALHKELYQRDCRRDCMY